MDLNNIMNRYFRCNILQEGSWQFNSALFMAEKHKILDKWERIYTYCKKEYGIDLEDRAMVTAYLLKHYKQNYQRYISDDLGQVLWDSPQMYYLLYIYMRKTPYETQILKFLEYYAYRCLYLQLDKINSATKVIKSDIFNYKTQVGINCSTMDSVKIPMFLTPNIQKLCEDTKDCYYVTVRNINGIATKMFVEEIPYSKALKQYVKGDILKGVGIRNVEDIIPFLLTHAKYNINGKYAKELSVYNNTLDIYREGIQKEKFKILSQLETANQELFEGCELKRVLRNGLIYKGPAKLGKYFKPLSEYSTIKGVISSVSG